MKEMHHMRTLIAGLIASLGLTANALGQLPDLVRPDSTKIVYRIEGIEPGRAPQGLILLAQGSGCNPVTVENRFELSETLAPGFARLTIEKYGVDPALELAEGECSEDFYARDTIDQRVLDAARVISALRGSDWWNGDLVLFGGSEGGAVVSMLTPIVPETDAVVVFSSGLGFTVEEGVLQAVPPPVRPMAEASFSAARQTGRIDERFSGHSHHWWANALDKRPSNALTGTVVPILVVQGTIDRSAVVESAREGVARLEASGACVTYDEREGLDHFMKDAQGADHRAEVYSDIALWIGEVVHGGVCGPG